MKHLALQYYLRMCPFSIATFNDIFTQWHFLQAGQVPTSGTIWSHIGMFRSNCLKVYGMSISYQVLLQKYHTLLDNIFCGFMDILEHIFNCYMVGVWLSAVKNTNGHFGMGRRSGLLGQFSCDKNKCSV